MRTCLGEQVLFKMDKTGTCEEVCMKDMAKNRDLNLVGFTPDMFMEVGDVVGAMCGSAGSSDVTFNRGAFRSSGGCGRRNSRQRDRSCA